MKRKKPTPRINREACERMWAKLVKIPGRCQLCGTTENLEAAHIVPRHFVWTRTDLSNGICLCRTHHREFHGDDALWQDYLDATVGRPEVRRLWAQARGGINTKFDWMEERARLKALHGVTFA